MSGSFVTRTLVTLAFSLVAFSACRGNIDAQPSAPAAAAPEAEALTLRRAGAPVSEADGALVLLHGYGGNGQNLLRAVAARFARSHPRLAVVAPEGRLPRPEGGRMWWGIEIVRVRAARVAGEWPALEREVPPGLPESHASVVRVLRELRAAGVPTERVVLAGFSQGAMLTTDVALRGGEPLGGAVVLSGAVVNLDAWRAATVSLPVTVVHGRNDSVLPFSQGERVNEELRARGADVSFVPFDGGHSIQREGFEALVTMVNRVVTAR